MKNESLFARHIVPVRALSPGEIAERERVLAKTRKHEETIRERSEARVYAPTKNRHFNRYEPNMVRERKELDERLRTLMQSE